MKYENWEVTPKEWRVIKKCLATLTLIETAKVIERSYFTVSHINESKSFQDYRRIIKEYGIKRAKNLVARLEG